MADICVVINRNARAEAKLATPALHKLLSRQYLEVFYFIYASWLSCDLNFEFGAKLTRTQRRE